MPSLTNGGIVNMKKTTNLKKMKRNSSVIAINNPISHLWPHTTIDNHHNQRYIGVWPKNEKYVLGIRNIDMYDCYVTMMTIIYLRPGNNWNGYNCNFNNPNNDIMTPHGMYYNGETNFYHHHHVRRLGPIPRRTSPRNRTSKHVLRPIIPNYYGALPHSHIHTLSWWIIIVFMYSNTTVVIVVTIVVVIHHYHGNFGTNPNIVPQPLPRSIWPWMS